MHIFTIIGARPQFIKAAVLSRYIRANPGLGIKETLVHTGQHYDENMSDVFFHEMEIPKPDINSNIGSGTHGKMTGKMLERIEALLIENRPDLVLVYGDTNSTLAGALAGSKLNIPIAHVEAGLRSYMMEMPEEQNRRLCDHLSAWLFCPTRQAIINLEKEGIYNRENNRRASADHKKVVHTGDIMLDASLYYRKINKHKERRRNFALLTLHRQENTDNRTRLESIVRAINSLEDIHFVFPVHPRTKKLLDEYGLSFQSNTELLPPVGYFEMIALEESCDFIITDSGGVQKEAYFFKKPCITLRDSTEWVELVESGWNHIVGADYTQIRNTVLDIKKPDEYPDFYGKGKTAQEIISVLKEDLQ